MKIKTNILIVGLGIIFSSNASILAFENKVKIGGVIDAQGVYYNTSGDTSQKKFSYHNTTQGLYSSGHFFIDYQLISDEGWKYGTKISLEQTTKNDRATPYGIYFESDYGKIEAGSMKSAGANMQISGFSIACAGASSWDSNVVHSPKHRDSTRKREVARIPYATNLGNFLDSKTRTMMKSDFSRKITYYSPKFGSEMHKFQLGLSYIPDSSNSGHNDITKPELFAAGSVAPYKFAIKDGISYGITYNGKFSEGLSVKIAFNGEKGKAIGFNENGHTRANIKFKDLNAYNMGAEIIYNNLSVAGSYMHYNKSLTNANIDNFGQNTGIYVVGTRYKFLENKFAASLNHFYSNHKKNKVNANCLGIDYNIAKGLKAYFQYTRFETKGKYMDNGIVKHNSSKGNIMILGGKISF